MRQFTRNMSKFFGWGDPEKAYEQGSADDRRSDARSEQHASEAAARGQPTERGARGESPANGPRSEADIPTDDDPQSGKSDRHVDDPAVPNAHNSAPRGSVPRIGSMRANIGSGPTIRRNAPHVESNAAAIDLVAAAAQPVSTDGTDPVVSSLRTERNDTNETGGVSDLLDESLLVSAGLARPSESSKREAYGRAQAAMQSAAAALDAEAESHLLDARPADSEANAGGSAKVGQQGEHVLAEQYATFGKRRL